jgi:hypothetical protein
MGQRCAGAASHSTHQCTPGDARRLKSPFPHQKQERPGETGPFSRLRVGFAHQLLTDLTFWSTVRLEDQARQLARADAFSKSCVGRMPRDSGLETITADDAER